MNNNQIVTGRFSNPGSEALFLSLWQAEPNLATDFYDRGKQCGACSFFAPFDSDWGLCCHPQSRHHLETVFEHFTCPTYVEEGWETHHFLTPTQRQNIENFEKREVALGQLVSTYVDTHNLGTIIRNGSYLLHEHLWPFDLDLGFVAQGRELKLHDGAYAVAPDLAIKIVTSFDKAEDLNFEVLMFLQAGTRQVWVAYPSYYYFGANLCVYSLTSDLDFQVAILAKGDTLDGDEVLPGFRVPVREVFQ